MVIRHHPKIGHLWVANQTARIPHERGGYIVRTNSQGFRSDVEFRNRRGARPRILFFGDSVTAGDGCYNRERFAEQTADILDAEVYNYGLSGSGTDQHLLLFEEFARDVEADLIVLGLTVHNIERIKAAYRPTIDRISRRRLLVPKPYFTLGEGGRLDLHNVPVPTERPEEGKPLEAVHSKEAHRQANPGLRWAYRIADLLRGDPRFDRIGRFLSPQSIEDHTRLRSWLLRLTGFDPLPDYEDAQSNGRRLMEAIVHRFIEQAAPCPVLLVPIPDQNYYLVEVEPSYQPFFDRFASSERNVHVADITTPLRQLAFRQRKRLTFEYDGHFSPDGHRKVAELIAGEIRSRGLLSRQKPVAIEPRPAAIPKAAVEPRPAAIPRPAAPTHILGISCFYHNSAASLIRDGEIVAAAEEERFSRVKNDRRFPAGAVNFCLEQAGIDVADLEAVVYYDNTQLTFERLMSTALAVEQEGRDLWLRMMPSWVKYKLRLPALIRRYLQYDGAILQSLHHRSHAASAFFPSPFKQAAILTIDGVGEWATASIGVGRENRVELLKEMHFPHSLGLLYSAFTQFTGFKVNNGEYKMMGLAPYGRPVYVDAILENLVDLKEDGSVELNLDYFAFLSRPTMTNRRFADLFGGPAREPESRITRREMDIARSVQLVTEEAMLRMARQAKRLTGESKLCIAGGVALNCVANGRIVREGPFEDIWIQPAAGDSGASLGAAQDAYHTYFGKPRIYRRDGRSPQQGSLLGPQFSDDEVEAFLQTYEYPYRKLTPEQRADAIAEMLQDGKVVGHFAGRTEFGPRALGSRSILGDPRNQQMQVNLNLKIKYRESFRPFAPTVLAEQISDYFDLDRESPYMLLVAPVKRDRRLPFDRGDDEDMLEIVRMPRSDVPAITHVDYSARVQSIARQDHPLYYDTLKAFERRTGCGVIVNTSFNVRGEPIVNTPQDAYRCFMRTEMDALVLGNCLVLKEQQPPWPEPKGHIDEHAVESVPLNPALAAALTRLFERDFLPLAGPMNAGNGSPLLRPFKNRTSTWEDHADPETPEGIFHYPSELLDDDSAPARLAAAITRQWSNRALAEMLTPLVAKLIKTGRKFADENELVEEVSESIYVMF